MKELLPTKSSFRPDEAIEIEVRGSVAPGTVRAWHLGDLAAEQSFDGSGLIRLDSNT